MSRPAVTQSPPCPARDGGHHEKKEHQDKPVRMLDIAADHEEDNAARTNADGRTLQQRAKVVSFGWRCWLACAREALVGAGVDFLVDLIEERRNHRVAVLRAQLIVRRSGGVDFLAGQGWVTHGETVALSALSRHQPDG
jgi:hypothetical protein